jgi:hypothetical protein
MPSKSKPKPKPKPKLPNPPPQPPTRLPPPKDEPPPKPPPPAQHVPVSSSNLSSVTYNRSDSTLIAHFHRGGSYIFYGVPLATFHALLSAPSKGRFFYYNIRHVFPYSKL